MAGHFIKRCRVCDKVMGQCRCPDRNKVVRYGVCPECAAKADPE